jgi:protein gp37
MYRDKERYGQDPTTVLRSKSTFNDPLKWKEPKLIFTCSWSDWFIDEADEWRDEAWKIIKNTPQHTYQILTKRPENIAARLPSDWGEGYENVWLGVSVEHQDAANERIESLLYVKAKTRFLSIEPLLSEVDLTRISETQFSAGTDCLRGRRHRLFSENKPMPKVDWVIVGGESGNINGKYKYRPCELDWIRAIVGQCEGANVPVFVKQFGTHLAKEMNLKDAHGGDIAEFPADLQIREMPKV